MPERMLTAILLAGALSVTIAAEAQTSDDRYINDQGYRTKHYRAPTPDQVPHGTTIDTATLLQLIEDKNPVLIDVQAVVVRPELAEFGMSWLPNEPRYHLPGSVWLPNVGYGELKPEMDRYFRDNLQQLSADDVDQPIVIYCVQDCWMSWNAVQRAASYGYRQLYWYPAGSDGWQQHGLELVQGDPVPLAQENQ